jgi:hypothetical protein
MATIVLAELFWDGRHLDRILSRYVKANLLKFITVINIPYYNIKQKEQLFPFFTPFVFQLRENI